MIENSNKTLKCPECNGHLTATKACKWRWRVKCSLCDFERILTYPQLLGFIEWVKGLNEKKQTLP